LTLLLLLLDEIFLLLSPFFSARGKRGSPLVDLSHDGGIIEGEGVYIT